MINKQLIGSKYFFSKYNDYTSHDTDYLTIEDNPKDYNSHMRITSTDRKVDYLYWKKNTPEWHINYMLNESKLPLEVGKYLIPEVCKELGITLQHLKQLTSVFDKLDDKHKYEKIIFEAYLENGEMTLSNKQRDLAYKSYKESRK